MSKEVMIAWKERERKREREKELEYKYVNGPFRLFLRMIW